MGPRELSAEAARSTIGTVSLAVCDNEAHALVAPTAETRPAQKRNFSRLARESQPSVRPYWRW
jgi:hypothetical protein